MTQRNEPEAHFCAGCGAAQRPSLRYPWYFCRECRDSACDSEGRRVVCGNIAVSGGFAWRYADEDESAARSCIGLIALIRGRPVYLHKARFGGIVGEPMSSVERPDRRGVWRIDGRFPVEPKD